GRIRTPDRRIRSPPAELDGVGDAGAITVLTCGFATWWFPLVRDVFGCRRGLFADLQGRAFVDALEHPRASQLPPAPLGEPAPHAEHDLVVDRVLEALAPHRAPLADGDGHGDGLAAGRPSLSLRSRIQDFCFDWVERRSAGFDD